MAQYFHLPKSDLQNINSFHGAYNPSTPIYVQIHQDGQTETEPKEIFNYDPWEGTCIIDGKKHRIEINEEIARLEPC